MLYQGGTKTMTLSLLQISALEEAQNPEARRQRGLQVRRKHGKEDIPKKLWNNVSWSYRRKRTYASQAIKEDLREQGLQVSNPG